MLRLGIRNYEYHQGHQDWKFYLLREGTMLTQVVVLEFLSHYREFGSDWYRLKQSQYQYDWHRHQDYSPVILSQQMQAFLQPRQLQSDLPVVYQAFLLSAMECYSLLLSGFARYHQTFSNQKFITFQTISATKC